MKNRFIYISKIFILSLLVVVLSIPATSYSKAEEENHAGHDERGEDEGDQHEEGIVELDQEAQEMIQLKTVMVEKRHVEYRLKAFGKVAKDTEEHFYVTADEGIVEKIQVGLGAAVEKGNALLTVRKSDGSLQDVLSENTGVILAIYVKQGDHVDRLKSLMSIVNIDKLRVTVDVYEKDIGFVKTGQKAEIESIAFVGKKFLGEVVYISPQVEEESQAIKVRIDVDNSEHLLRLGMFVSTELIYNSDKEVAAIPQSAVQELNGEDIVFVKESENKFALKEVTIGQIFGEYVEIKTGVAENEQVVTQGSFSLKSEQAKESFGDGHGH